MVFLFLITKLQKIINCVYTCLDLLRTMLLESNVWNMLKRLYITTDLKLA